MKWSKTSRRRMENVHPDLVAIADRALGYGVLDLTVLREGGTRTEEQQSVLVKKGVSQTMNSLHLIQADGFGYAIDLAPYPVDWKNIQAFCLMGTLMFRAAMELGTYIEWGGHWVTFEDYPHFQLKRDHTPNSV